MEKFNEEAERSSSGGLEKWERNSNESSHMLRNKRCNCETGIEMKQEETRGDKGGGVKNHVSHRRFW